MPRAATVSMTSHSSVSGFCQQSGTEGPSPGQIHSPGLNVDQAVNQALPALQGVALAKALHLSWLYQLHLCRNVVPVSVAGPLRVLH